MSSSADFSDEDDFSQKSGSASPAPGDTLPWNLPKHERSKRKIHGGSVLDPAERAVLRIAGKRIRGGDEARTGVKEIHPSAPPQGPRSWELMPGAEICVQGGGGG